MFTGLIEETGYVKSLVKNTNGATLVITCKLILGDIKIGDSICVNGVCETVTNIFSDGFEVRISDETLGVTHLGNLKNGDILNLERALTLNSRLGGHIVSGHIDCVGKLTNIEKLSDFYNLTFEIPENYSKYIVYKGSVAISGISLTIAKTTDNIFKVAIIPHTYQNTNLKNTKIGDFVNIETDILGKYVEKMLSANDNKEENTISIDFLKENGFV